jgi:sarcosine oxidase
LTTPYDVCVIGAGAIGAAAAYHAARAGHRVLLLEQFTLDHPYGSSYGHSRIIRYAYDHPTYIEMARQVYPLWHLLEAEAGKRLLVKSGGLDLGKPDHPRYAATRQAMKDAGIPFIELTPERAAKRYPLFKLDAGMMALYQGDAGILRASECVMTQIRLAQEKHNLTIQQEATVLNIRPTSDRVTVVASTGIYSASHLIIAAGSWSAPLLAELDIHLPLEATRQQLLFFAANPAELFTPERFPIFIAWGDEVFYGTGDVAGTGVKIAQHGGGSVVQPNQVLRTVDSTYIDKIRRFLRHHIPVLAGSSIVESRVCLYTNTPDEHFIIDHHPDYPHIAFGAGFSGHGFKFSTLVGKLLVDKVTGKAINLDLSVFRHNRFKI